MTHTIRATLTFPGRASDGGISSIGIPGPERLGNGLAGPLPAARHRLETPASDRGAPLVGIGIAPDSPIEACTIYLEDGNEHRISPGSPLIADTAPGVSHVDVTVPISIPALPFAGGANAALAWDAELVDLANGSAVMGWPLRLELYYGGVPPRASRRAAYHARVAAVHPASGTTSSTYFMLDGRRSAEAQILSPVGGAMAVRILRIDGTAQDPRFDNGQISIMIPGETTDEDDPAVVPLHQGLNRFLLSAEARMPTIIAVQLVGDLSDQANAGTYQIGVTAE